MVVANMDGPTRDQVLKLMNEKEKIENEIAQLSKILETNNNVGMEESLVDDNGFPRNDIDVYQVRYARHRIICLQNDHKSLMKQIEKGLHVLHSTNKTTSSDASSSNPQSSTSSESVGSTNSQPEVAVNVHTSVTPCMSRLRVSNIKAIAKVNFVSAGSPAEDAGIKVDDQIVEFGSLNPSNFKELTQIADIVQNSINCTINLKVLRDSTLMDVSLTPHTWSGRGMLGCNVIPIND